MLFCNSFAEHPNMGATLAPPISIFWERRKESCMKTFIIENIFLVFSLLAALVGLIYMYLFSNVVPNLKSLYKLSTSLAFWAIGAIFFFLHISAPHRATPFFIEIVCGISAFLLLASAIILFFVTRSIEKENNKKEGDS